MADGGASGSDGSSSWFTRRQSTKRNFSTMSASDRHHDHHRDESPNPLFIPHSEQVAARRRRIRLSRERTEHYPGDGLDFRRPVMSAGEDGGSDGNMHVNVSSDALPVIDLTDDSQQDIDMEGQQDEADGGARFTTGRDRRQREGRHTSTSAAAAAAQRPPRFGRNIIDVEDNDREQGNRGNHNHRASTPSMDDDLPTARLPGANYLALPPRRSGSGRAQYSSLRRPTRPPSPPREMDDGEIEFVGSRSFAPVQQRQSTPGFAPHADNNAPRSVTPYPTGLNEPIDLTEDADDDVLFVDERRRTGVNLDRPAGTIRAGGQGMAIGQLVNVLREGGAALGGRLAQRVQGLNNRWLNHADYAQMDLDQIRARRRQLEAAHAEQQALAAEIIQVGRRERANIDPPRRPRSRWGLMGADDNGMAEYGGAPENPADRPRPARPGPGLVDIGNMMDYGMTGFDMGYGGAPARPPSPKYSPPDAPENGFTRNPGEDEVVVCPNCGDELAVGEEEAKQEIWIIKGCGHAYCGDCAQHRSKSSNKKGKGRAMDAPHLQTVPQPFKHCVVQGCGKSASAKSMIRVFFLS